MRRILLLGLVLSLALFAAACGGSEEKNTAPETVVGNTGAGTEPEGEETTEDEGEGEGDAAAGKDVFTENCGSCHTLADAGTTGTVGPGLDDTSLDEAAIMAQVENGGGAMPAFAGQLSEQEIADVSAYVAEAAGS